MSFLTYDNHVCFFFFHSNVELNQNAISSQFVLQLDINSHWFVDFSNSYPITGCEWVLLKAQQQLCCNPELASWIFLPTICTHPYCYSTTDMLFVIYPTNALLMRGATASDSCCIHFLLRWFYPSLINCTSSKITMQMQIKWQQCHNKLFLVNYSISVRKCTSVLYQSRSTNTFMPSIFL